MAGDDVAVVQWAEGRLVGEGEDEGGVRSEMDGWPYKDRSVGGGGRSPNVAGFGDRRAAERTCHADLAGTQGEGRGNMGVV